MSSNTGLKIAWALLGISPLALINTYLALGIITVQYLFLGYCIYRISELL